MTKMVSNKKGLQMSINTLTAIILAMMVFGAGLAIFQSINGKGKDWQGQINSELEKKVRDMANNGQPVTIYPKVVNVDEDYEVIYLGILNVYDETLEFKFYVPISGDAIADTISYLDNVDVPIPAKTVKSFTIGLETKKYPKGESAIRIKVEYKDPDTGTYTQYKNPVLIYVNK